MGEGGGMRDERETVDHPPHHGGRSACAGSARRPASSGRPCREAPADTRGVLVSLTSSAGIRLSNWPYSVSSPAPARLFVRPLASAYEAAQLARRTGTPTTATTSRRPRG